MRKINGTTITIIRRIVIRIAVQFFDLSFLYKRLYKGAKINTKMNPKIIENNIGFSKRNAKIDNNIKTAATTISLR